LLCKLYATARAYIQATTTTTTTTKDKQIPILSPILALDPGPLSNTNFNSVTLLLLYYIPFILKKSVPVGGAFMPMFVLSGSRGVRGRP